MEDEGVPVDAQGHEGPVGGYDLRDVGPRVAPQLVPGDVEVPDGLVPYHGEEEAHKLAPERVAPRGHVQLVHSAVVDALCEVLDHRLPLLRLPPKAPRDVERLERPVPSDRSKQFG